MDTQTLDSFRRKLIHRGQSLLGGDHQTPVGDQDSPPGRPTGRDDSTIKPAVAERRERVKEAEAIALIRIQASLARIAQGTFGDCVVCHAPIETERLRAIPEVDRCGGCTH